MLLLLSRRRPEECSVNLIDISFLPSLEYYSSCFGVAFGKYLRLLEVSQACQALLDL